MNLFGVGPLELAVILIVALIFVGPDRLPRLAADLARTIKEIRKYTSGLAAEFNEVVKDVERETSSERSLWRDVSESVGGATKQVTSVMREVRQEVMKGPEPRPDGTSPPPVPDVNDTQPPGNDSWVEVADPDLSEAQAADTAQR